MHDRNVVIYNHCGHRRSLYLWHFQTLVALKQHKLDFKSELCHNMCIAAGNANAILSRNY
jgi:hypothetical protein